MKKIKMTTCAACGKEIAANAKTCPACGAKHKKPVYKRWWFIVLVVFFILLLMPSGEEAPDLDSIEYTKYTVDKLEAILDENAAKAAELEGQYIELTGELTVIDSSGKYIGLYALEDVFDLEGVLCNITNDEQLERVKELTAGDKVTVRGKITDVGEVFGFTIDMTEIL